MLEEGWYLMSVADVEAVLAGRESATIKRLSTHEALAIRDAGNVPDELNRSLRLVLVVDDDDPEAFARRRIEFEPDYQEQPSWRREGSKPVNVIPVRKGPRGPAIDEWRDDPAVAALEEEWLESGTMAGVKVPAEYRSFVHKTVLALRATDSDVTAETIADSIARWVPPEDAARIRVALLELNG